MIIPTNRESSCNDCICQNYSNMIVFDILQPCQSSHYVEYNNLIIAFQMGMEKKANLHDDLTLLHIRTARGWEALRYLI